MKLLKILMLFSTIFCLPQPLKSQDPVDTLYKSSEYNTALYLYVGKYILPEPSLDYFLVSFLTIGVVNLPLKWYFFITKDKIVIYPLKKRWRKKRKGLEVHYYFDKLTELAIEFGKSQMSSLTLKGKVYDDFNRPVQKKNFIFLKTEEALKVTQILDSLDISYLRQ